MEQLFMLYPEATVSEDFFTIPLVLDVTVNINRDCTEVYAWDVKGKDYSENLLAVVKDVTIRNPQTDQITKLLLILQQFKDTFSTVAGFLSTTADEDAELDMPYYNPLTDGLWELLRKKLKVNTERNLHVFTYGTRFIFEQPDSCQMVFDAAILHGSEKVKWQKKLLEKLRGTDGRIQQDVRECAIFGSFLENIISNIEKQDLKSIAVICRAGRHRSVAIAEMLVHIYPNRTVEHLTIA
jgi:hypothetical protein